MKNISGKEIASKVGGIIGKAGYTYNQSDIELLFAITNHFNSHGYKLSYIEVSEFLVSKQNKTLIEEVGLRKTIEAMYYMKLGTIRKDKKVCRNDPCPCGSCKKYKKCCLRK